MAASISAAVVDVISTGAAEGLAADALGRATGGGATQPVSTEKTRTASKRPLTAAARRLLTDLLLEDLDGLVHRGRIVGQDIGRHAHVVVFRPADRPLVLLHRHVK